MCSCAAQDGFYYDVYCGGATIASAEKEDIEKFFEQAARPDALACSLARTHARMHARAHIPHAHFSLCLD
jgi:hypothetical protein